VGQPVQYLDKIATVNDHIRELVFRLSISLVAMLVVGTLVFAFYEQILAVLSSPLGQPLYYSNPAGSFNFIMKICFTGALIITIPILTFNLIMFIRPAFEKALSMRRILTTTGLSTLLAITGAAFAFYCILPGTLKFFSDFQVSGLKALISADSYLTFITNLIIMFVLVFQIPLFIIFMDHIKPLKPKKLLKKGKWIIVGSLIVTIIQPFTYDFVTSLYIALPIIVLYYISIAAVVIQHYLLRQKENKLIHSVIASPIINNVDESLLDNIVYENILGELSNLDKPKPISTIPSGHSVMDVKKTSIQTQQVQPAAWVLERKARRAEFSKKVHVFSDIRRPVNA